MRIKLLALLTVVSLCLTGCILSFDPVLRYSGAHTDLIAASIYSLPGVDSAIEDEVLILDTDAYGRTLFAVCHDQDLLVQDKKRSFDWKVLAILIVQRTDDSHVYFYGERNYRITSIDGTINLSNEVVEDAFSEAILEQLKAENDWNVPPEYTSIVAVKSPIQVEKGIRLSKTQEAALEEYLGSNLRDCFIRQDQQGRQLYFILEIQTYPAHSYTWYAAIFNPDGSLCCGDTGIRRLQGLSTIHKQLAHFLEEHHWVDIS